jgi:hypothetical protein
MEVGGVTAGAPTEPGFDVLDRQAVVANTICALASDQVGRTSDFRRDMAHVTGA